jgi:hypothetical protein
MAASLSLAAVAGTNCPKTAGVKELYTIPVGDMVSVTLGSDHDITDLVFAGVGNGFGKLNFKRGECEVTESMERSNEVSVNFAVANPTSTQRKELTAIKNSCEQYMVARLYDGDRLLFIGYDAESLEEGFVAFASFESTSGRAKSDDNLFSMTMTAEQGEPLRVLSGISGATVPATTVTAIVAELLAATSV